jgi:hypothetical protein
VAGADVELCAREGVILSDVTAALVYGFITLAVLSVREKKGDKQ